MLDLKKPLLLAGGLTLALAPTRAGVLALVFIFFGLD
jgi:hypothetical protein